MPNPYFTGETFSDRNAVADHQRNKNEILINSDTNALAVTSDQTKTKRKIYKQTSTTSKQHHQYVITSSAKKGKNKLDTIHKDNNSAAGVKSSPNRDSSAPD